MSAAAAVGSKDSRYKWEVLLVVMIGTLMAALDTSIVNCSAPIKKGHRRQLKLDTLTVEIFDTGVRNEMLAKCRESGAQAL